MGHQTSWKHCLLLLYAIVYVEKFVDGCSQDNSNYDPETCCNQPMTWCDSCVCGRTVCCPTPAPTLAPLNAPSAAPSFSPTPPPSNVPSFNPTFYPTNDPTSDPTANPTFLPTFIPTFYPTNDPTANPTFLPTTDPTKDPTEIPTINPTNDPTTDPTYDPTIDPTTDPTYDPTIDPTYDPTYDPTNDPTYDPTNDPTTDPTIDPTNDPTTDPTDDPTSDPTIDPTKDPTYDPTNDPTTDPTINPTHAPTYCFNAKYQHEMFGLQKDHLWSDETLVSSNCKYIIKMYKNGNLILHGYTGDRHKLFADLWMTNTTVYNRSGNSVPQFIIENGEVKVIEYQYVNVPGVPVIELWTSSNITIQNKNNIILTLTDDGCLVLIDANDEYKNNYIWKQCIKTITDIPITNTFIITGYDSDDSNDDTQNKTGNQSQNAGTLWWVWLLIILIIFIGFFVWFLIRKYYCIDNSTESQLWSTAEVTTEDVQNIYNTIAKENDTCSYETDQIDKWIKETEMGNIHGEGERNYHTSIFNTEIVFNNTNNVADTEQVFSE